MEIFDVNKINEIKNKLSSYGDLNVLLAMLESFKIKYSLHLKEDKGIIISLEDCSSYFEFDKYIDFEKVVG